MMCCEKTDMPVRATTLGFHKELGQLVEVCAQGSVWESGKKNQQMYCEETKYIVCVCVCECVCVHACVCACCGCVHFVCCVYVRVNVWFGDWFYTP